MSRVKEAILQSGTLAEGMFVLLGLSGGPDSLTLLHALHSMKDELKINIVPVHVNHMLRGEKSDAEQKHAEEICKDMGLECRSFSVDCNKLAEEYKVSVEEAGRAARYKTMSDLAESIVANGVPREAVVIAMAQNADDQSETVMFHIIRGTGLKGLSGIRPVRFESNGFLVVRPLLRVTRAEIEEYVKENGLEPNIDESNDVPEVARNKIRLELFPYIEKNLNENVKESLRRLADVAAVEDDYMEELAYTIYCDVAEGDTDTNSLILDTEKLAELHPAVLRRVLAFSIREYGLGESLSFAMVNALAELLYSDNPSARIDLPMGIVAEREYRKLRLRTPELVKEDPAAGMRLFASVVKAGSYDPKTEKLFAAFDYDSFEKTYPGKIPEITLRTRREGDYMVIGGGKHKKIQDIFVDDKIGKNVRDGVLLAAIGSEVLWILPHPSLKRAAEREKGKFSQNYRVTDKSEQVLFLEIVRDI
jgi:tRNA(Ile)-lysidine synthase